LYKKRKSNGDDEWRVVFYSYCTNINASLQYTTTLYAKRWGIDCDTQSCLTEYRIMGNITLYLALQRLDVPTQICVTGNGFVESSGDNVPTRVTINSIWARQDI
jgi:hypothetical protein